ncbi:MAG: hypothetical protein V4538_10610 [Bacteroidota bacterium]
MNKILVSLALIMLLMSCTKEESTLSIKLNSVVLTELGDSATLSWTVANSSSKIEYFRLSGNFDGGESMDFYNNNNHITIKIPTVPLLTFQVTAFSSKDIDLAKSNIITITKPGIKLLNMDVKDGLYDNLNNNIVLVDPIGKIALYSLNTNSIVNMVTSNSKLGYCDLIVNQDTAKLIVPRNDGWVFIYNAKNLELIDQVQIHNAPLTSVISQSDLFFSSSSTGSTFFQVYNRKTKTTVHADVNSQKEYRMKVIPESLPAILQTNQNNKLCIKRFSDLGNITDTKEYKGSPLNASTTDILEMSPATKKIATSNRGIILNTNLGYLATLKTDSATWFTAFAFDSDKKEIIGATTLKNIQFYAEANYQKTKTIKTEGYPVKILKVPGKVVCISSILKPVESVEPGQEGNVKPNSFVEIFEN